MEESRPGFIRRNFNRLMSFISALRLLTINLVFILIVVVLIVAITQSDIPTIPEKGALVLNIQGTLVDQKNYIDPFTQILGKTDPEQREVLVQDVIDAIHYAEKDERITTLVLLLDHMLYGGISKMQEIAPALDAFRQSGKKIIAYGDGYSQDQYWLAAQADEVYLHPMGGVLLQGYGVYRNYFKDALDKLQVNVHIFRVGEYKSAMEPFIRNDMSEEAREANLVWLEDLWGVFTRELAQRRGMPESAVDDYINNMDKVLEQNQGDTAQAAVTTGLVDGVKNRADINGYLVEQVGAADKEGYFQGVGFERYLWLKRLEPDPTALKIDKKVGVIVAAGDIVDGEQPPGDIGGDTLASLIRQAQQDEEIQALVLRVDSGGGSAFASDVIRNELELLQKAGKPVVISMGSLAASGGYWIAAGADEIWATPTTLTGSIGIFGAFPTIEKSLSKMGVSTDGVGTTELSGAMRLDRPLSPMAERFIQRNIENLYQRFISLVAEGRDLPMDEVKRIAGGRVWSGEDALELGLVDQLGGLQQAIESAAKLAGLAQYETKAIEIPLTPQEQFLKELAGQAAIWFPSMDLSVMGLSELAVLSNFQQWLLPLQNNLSFLATMNDPNGVYSHCSQCIAP